MKTIDALFEPFTLKGNIVLENRFVLSPMVTNSSTEEGHITKDDLLYAKRRAGSAALQITGAAYVNKQGQLFEFGFSAMDEAAIPGLKKLAQEMKSQGATAILQLTHAGRFASHALNRDKTVVGPSAMKLQSPFPHEVHEMTIEEIHQVIEDYRRATKIAIEAGFDGVEISSAQRLLIQTFFSTFSNERTDEYGSQSLENRSRIGIEVLKVVQETIGQYAGENFILGFRATPEETRGNQIGYSIDEFLEFFHQALTIASIDYLAIASWGHDVFRNKIRAKGPHQGELVNAVIYKALKGKVAVIASGGINSQEKALEALEHADLVGLSTPFITDPEFAKKIKEGKSEEIQLSIKPENLEELAIPQAAFKDIVPLMDFGESLHKDARDFFRSLEVNYKERAVDEN